MGVVLNQTVLDGVTMGLELALRAVDFTKDPEDERKIKRALRWGYEQMEKRGADVSGVKREIMEAK